MTKFEEFIELCDKSMKLCPWASSQDVETYIKEIATEANEALEAVKDKEHLKDELGDVLLDWAHAVMHAGFTPDEVIQGATDKLNRRKPYLKDGKTVTLDEARKLWRNVKAEELSEKEMVDIVDDNGQVLHSCTRSESDAKKSKRMASRVIVRDSKGRFLLQRREEHKKIYPGMWDFGVAETVQSKESHLHAAIRGLKEEMNISVTEKDMKHLFDYSYEDEIVNRYNGVFELIYDGKYEFDEVEVSEAGWYTTVQVKSMLQSLKFPPITMKLFKMYEEYNAS